jgi:CRP-like cAMP-binding protein
MSEFNPFVLRRMLALRRFTIFADAELAELVMIAENVVEATFPAGAVIAPAHARLPGLHFVLEGGIQSGGAAFGPHQAFGALEVLAGRDLAAPAIAVTETHTLQLFASDIAEVLEDNFSILRATLRVLAAQLLARGQPLQRSTSGGPITVPLGLVERLLLLRQQPPFARAHLDALAALAHRSTEVRWSPGQTVARAGELADGAWVIVQGSLAATSASGARVLGPGDTIGPLETLAELRHGATIEATSEVRALQSSATTLFDVIEDHADFGLAMIATFAGALLDVAAGSTGDGVGVGVA